MSFTCNWPARPSPFPSKILVAGIWSLTTRSPSSRAFQGNTFLTHSLTLLEAIVFVLSVRSTFPRNYFPRCFPHLSRSSATGPFFPCVEPPVAYGSFATTRCLCQVQFLFLSASLGALFFFSTPPSFPPRMHDTPRSPR